MLRIAVPNKGSLSEPAISILAEAGYKTRRRGRELVLTDSTNDVELFFLRPRDIAVYVGRGSIQVGITGRDLLLDSGTSAIEHRALGFAHSTFRFAAPLGQMTSLADIAGKRVGAWSAAISLNTVSRLRSCTLMAPSNPPSDWASLI